MVWWGYSNGELRIRDSKKNELTIQTEEWEPVEKDVDIDRPTEGTIAGQTSGICFQNFPIAIKNADEKWKTYFDSIGQLDLSKGEYLVQILGSVIIHSSSV